MMASVLTDRWLSRWQKAPIRILARNGGIYRLPIVVHAIDFRCEDNPAIDLHQVLGHDWVAKHPVDDFYIVGIHGEIEATHADRALIRKLQHDGVLAPDVYHLPNLWWEFAVGFDKNYHIIKAPKRPRSGEPTPEEVDERIAENVRTKAYFMWREAGSPPSSGWEFWVRAESYCLQLTT